jgi:hypothetical protein
MPFTILSRYQQALARRSQHWSPTTRGLLWTSAAGFIFSMLNALMRLLTQQIDPFQAQFLRYAFGLLVILPLVWRGGLANFMPRVVGRLVMQPDAPSVPGERDRVIGLIRSLDAYSLMPALKGIMVSLTGDAAWLRVRAPLVALTPAQLAAIGQVVREFSLDLAKD